MTFIQGLSVCVTETTEVMPGAHGEETTVPEQQEGGFGATG